MGRYYSGDIEGKFWFAVQSSTDADFFGKARVEGNYVNYGFNREHLKDIEHGIFECRKHLGKWEPKLDNFFKKNDEGYNDNMLEEQIGLSKSECKEILEWYARLGLGKEILNSVKEHGQCYFEAEL